MMSRDAGRPSRTCDEGEQEEKSEERRWEEGQAVPFYLTMLVPGL